MKKAVAVALLLALVLSLCAPAFAVTYPSGQFTSSSKDTWVKYGKNIQWKLKLNCGSYNRVMSQSYEWILRSGLTLHVRKGGSSEKIADIDFWGKPTYTKKVKTSEVTVITKPKKLTKYKITAQLWYKPTVGYTVYNWQKCGSKSTNFWVY